MKRYLTILTVGGLLGLSVDSGAQDIHFSQFYENAILRNPGLTGIFTGDYKVGVDYRSQWGSVTMPYKTFMISGETRILVNREVGDYLSLGLVATSDQAGSINFASQQVYPAIAFNKAIEDQYHTYLTVGLTGGYLHRSVDQSKMTFSSQYVNGNYNANNPTLEGSQYKSMNSYDVGAGVSINSSFDPYGRTNYYLGVSAYHLNRPTQIFTGGDVLTKLPMKFQFNGGFHFPVSDPLSISLHANYSMQQPYSEFVFGGFLTWRSIPIALPSVFAINFGAFYRVNDAFIPMIKIDYKNVSFGYTYDATNSSLASNTTSGTGSSEITFYVRGTYNHRKDPRDPMMCPRFDGISAQ